MASRLARPKVSRLHIMKSQFRTILTNRFFLLPVLLMAVVFLWNMYISLHNGGLVRGWVMGPDGAPVAGATVRLMEQNFTTNSDRGQAVTQADGRFEFADNRSHNIQLRAEKDGWIRSEQRVVRLYFRAQNTTLDAPLVLKALPSK